MVSGGATFERLLSRHARAIEALENRGVMLVGSFPDGGRLLDPECAFLNASALDDGGVEVLHLAFENKVFETIRGPVLVDVEKAAVAHKALGASRDGADVRRAILRGRVCLQGTDGVRGPVSLVEEGNAVLHFGRTGEITPVLIETLCRAFAAMTESAGVSGAGDTVLVAEDGRDVVTGGALSQAMKRGLAAGGLSVVDMGVAPTPAVPFALVHENLRLGAVLTASHNPATQNGIKFFIDGAKMLPEGPLGDFALTARAYQISQETETTGPAGGVTDGRRLIETFVDFVASSVSRDAVEALRGLHIVFDPANGAWADIGMKVFERLGLSVTAVNCQPRGHNINQGGGVAEIEGREVITAAQAADDSSLSSVAALLDAAGRRGGAYAIVTDGDGDRGFVLAAADAAKALVVDGDALAYITARYMREAGIIADNDASSCEFVGTVESDLEVFRAVSGTLGLATRIACVGDKWLAARTTDGLSLAVGEEVSGHVIFPMEVSDGRTVLAGNGLVTALTALSAVAIMGLSPAEMARPFSRGVFATRYTYNVDKALFFHGSKAWNEDLKAISATLEERKAAFASWRIIEMPDEPDMLYVGLEDEGGRLAGAVFVRNSGTENKTSVYARGAGELEGVLEGLCQILWEKHRETLKAETSETYGVEKAVLELLSAGPMAEDGLIKAINSAVSAGADPGQVQAVMYGMRKEGLIDRRGGSVERLV